MPCVLYTVAAPPPAAAAEEFSCGDILYFVMLVSFFLYHWIVGVDNEIAIGLTKCSVWLLKYITILSPLSPGGEYRN